MIPKSVIEDIKFRNNIEDVISSYVTLTRAGSNVKGLCPFHSEKTPSFTVFPESQSFYCFGCGAAGDVISFVMKAENLDYRAAVESLAARAGITLPDERDDRFLNRGPTRTRILEMNTCAARFFRDVLNDEKLGAPGREYIAKRGLSPQIVRRFGLGYAPSSFGMLRDHLRSAGFSDEEMTVGFFCGRSKKNGALYDYFRDRLMFPLIDVSGNIVAFGGRIIGDGEPKYLNTSDTPAFKKSKMLFGLNYAKNTEADHIILCEGNIDVISLHDGGFENAVATLGTAITPDHARLLRKYCEKVLVCYDGDAAGERATEKAVKILDEVGLETKIIRMTGAKDPDEFIKRFGREAFKKLCDESASRFDYVISTVMAKYRDRGDDGKAEAARVLCAKAAAVYSKVERDIVIGKIAKALDIAPESVRYDVEAVARRKARVARKEEHTEIVRTTSGISDRVNPDFARGPKAARLEEIVLGMMLLRDDLITRAEGMLSEEELFTSFGKKVFSLVMKYHKEGGFDMAYLNDEMSPDEVSRAMKLAMSRKKLKNTDEIFDEAVASLKAEARKRTDLKNEDLEEKIRRLREENK